MLSKVNQPHIAPRAYRLRPTPAPACWESTNSSRAQWWSRKASNGQNAKKTNVQCFRILVRRHVDVPKPLLSRNTRSFVPGVAIMRHVCRLRDTKKRQIMTAVDGSNLHVTTQFRMMCPKKSKNLMQPSAQCKAVNSTQGRQLKAGPSTQRKIINSTQCRQLNAVNSTQGRPLNANSTQVRPLNTGPSGRQLGP